MTDKANQINEIKDKELIFMRILDAPQELVWKALTEPERLKEWWGPNGFSLTTFETDLKPGGVWRFMMHGPDGIDYPNKVNFIEVVKPERLVYRHSGDDDTEPVNFHVTVTLEKQGGKTKMVMHSVFESAEELARLNREHGAIEGAKQHLARLEEYLSILNKNN